MKSSLISQMILLQIGTMLATSVFAADDASTQPEVASKAQQMLEQAAADQKYTFLFFYKEDTSASRSMAEAAKQVVKKRSDQATLTFVQISNPAEKNIVKQYGVGRAAMPMVMIIAPNGAITGVLPQRFTEQNVENAFVTPTMMRAMKSLQEGKLVLVCVRGSEETFVPPAVTDFQTDPHFKDRMTNVAFSAADPAETKLLNQMQIDPKSTSTKTVLLAPPGVMVGKFDAAATKDDIAAALAQAGKCCNDPNCKHNRQASPNASGGTSQQSQRPRR